MNKKPGKVLYVDDEEINLVNFKEAFYGEFEVFTALSAEEALAVLEKEKDMALVITDQRMPGMKGTDLLAKTRELAPNAERIIITGYTAPQDLIAAINEGHVYRYILKPWAEDELRITITQAVERYHLIQHNRKLMEKLRQKNLELEDRVKERTAKLAMANQTLTAKIEELEKTQFELKTLQGLLAICSYCKKIRDDDNSWVQMEEYLKDNSDLLFSHSICPDCLAQVMKKLNQESKMLRKET
jgi:response regulator RpfG family c-di-GMP phosphodiesterase